MSVPPLFSTICMQNSEDHLSCQKLVLFHNSPIFYVCITYQNIINLWENSLKLISHRKIAASNTHASGRSTHEFQILIVNGFSFRNCATTSYQSFPHKIMLECSFIWVPHTFFLSYPFSKIWFFWTLYSKTP